MLPEELDNQREAPLVSVLICSYNAEEFIKTTVRSVMNQTYRDLEILVLDNASEDGTVGVLEGLCGEDPRIMLFVGRDNLGAYGGLNYLLDRAKGTYIAIQDHDDIWHKDKIRRQIEFLEKHEEYVGCGTAIVNHYKKYDIFLLRRQPNMSCIAWHTSLVFRNYNFRYNAEVKVANDFHFMRNVLCKSGERIYNLSEPYVLRAIRADRSNLSTRWITFETLSDLLRLKIGIADKLAFLNRLLLPNRIVDYVVLHVLLRRNILEWSDVQQYFVGSERF